MDKAIVITPKAICTALSQPGVFCQYINYLLLQIRHDDIEI
jgi:hypothetical protein